MTPKTLKNKIRLAFVAEYFAGGFYLEIAKSFTDRPDIAERLRKTAGDEIRHGGYFNRCLEEEFGQPIRYTKQLIQAGHFVGKVINLVPARFVPQQTRLNILSKGEAAAVRALEKELAEHASNPYLEIVQRILPDERTHADRYTLS